MGRSLGGAVAIDLASKHTGESGLPGAVAGVIAENTFASISSMVDVVFPYIAAAKGLILRMKWESVVKIKHIQVPILFISGTQVSGLFFHIAIIFCLFVFSSISFSGFLFFFFFFFFFF